ncbi:hypothetical protein LRY29_00080 [Candidatus Saccharibacteria bacterium]|nr:hypothetical protein [Candidatus Saccharibacteria bacterium]
MKHRVPIRIAGLVAVTALVGGLVVSSTASAQSSTNTRQEVSAARCTIAEAKIQAHIERIHRVQDSQLSVYQKAIDTATSIQTRAQEDQYDTAVIDAAIEKVEASYALAKANFEAYATSLTATQGFACGQSEGQFLAALKDSRAALAEARTSTLQLRADIRGELLPSLKEYGASIKAQTGTTEEAN